jgi:hypothetical protein
MLKSSFWKALKLSCIINVTCCGRQNCGDTTAQQQQQQEQQQEQQ